MSKKFSKIDIKKELTSTGKNAKNVLSKTAKTATNIIDKTGKTAADTLGKVTKITKEFINDTGKKTENILKKSNASIKKSSSQKPLEIDLNAIKLTIQMSSIIKIILFSIFLTYVIKLETDENCECSKGWERGYIKYYSIAVILFALVQIFFTQAYFNFKIIHSLLGIGGIVFIISVVKYINELKEIDCKCSKSWKRRTLNIYAWLSIIMLVITFIGTIAFISRMNKA